jgi:hypothetical protein
VPDDVDTDNKEAGIREYTGQVLEVEPVATKTVVDQHSSAPRRDLRGPAVMSGEPAHRQGESSQVPIVHGASTPARAVNGQRRSRPHRGSSSEHLI